MVSVLRAFRRGGRCYTRWAAALIPLFVSGGIHLDGLCDTCDALCSFGDRDKRLAILKDPHVGAFGPMWLMAFLLAEAACFAQIYETPTLLPLACVVSPWRARWVDARLCCRPAQRTPGLAHIFAENSDKKAVAVALIIELCCL